MNSQTIGDYLIKRTIGRGTFSKVKLAVNKTTSQKVAIKILEKSKIIEPDDLERIVREMAIIIEFNHPNVVVVHEIFETDEHYLIIMDYCSGGELFNYIVVNQRLEEDEASFFYYQLINGVEYIHSKNIVHRDLKPQNIMLLNDSTTDIQIKIMDFGLSKVIAQNEKLKEGMGTITYIAPEILIGNSYDFKVDVWSLGVTWFYVLSGHFPFDDNNSEINEEMFVNNAVNQELMFFKKEWDKYKKENVKLIAKCLVKEPEKRISVDEFIKKIKVK